MLEHNGKKIKMIDLFRPYVPEEAIEAVVEVLKSRFIGQGPKVDEFEKEFEKLFNVQHAVAVNSGTSALETAYDLVGLGVGDEVIVPVLNCTAGGTALLRRKCKIIFADILEKTLCIDPVDVRAKITDKTKAVVQTHLGGVQANIGKLHIPVISDACQALGIFTGQYDCLSFQAIKHIGTSDLGMIVLNNPEEAHKAKLLRWFGIDREKKIANNWQAFKTRKMTFDIELPGCKRQPNDIAAVMALIGLKHYYEILNHRKKLFDIYKKELANIDGIKLIDGQENVHWLCTLLVERREEFAKMLFDAGVDSNLVQIRNDIYKVFGGQRQDLPIMNKIEEKYISIPCGRNVSEENVYYIANAIKKGWN